MFVFTPESGNELRSFVPYPNFPMGSTLRRIQRCGRVRIGVVDGMPGFSELIPGTRTRRGFDIEVSKLLARSIFGGTTSSAAQLVDFVGLSVAERECALEDGLVDFVVSVFAITEERRKRIDFSIPYYGASLGVLVRCESMVTELSHLDGCRLGVACGSVGSAFVRRNQVGQSLSEFDSISDMVGAVSAGDIDACITTAPVLRRYALHDPTHLRTLAGSLTQVRHGIGAPKGDEQTLDFLSHEIESLWDDGLLLRLSSEVNREAR